MCRGTLNHLIAINSYIYICVYVYCIPQVNPHSALLSTLSVQATVWSNPFYGITAGLLRFMKAQLKDYISNIVDLMVYRRIAPSWGARRGIHQFLTQVRIVI